MSGTGGKWNRTTHASDQRRRHLITPGSQTAITAADPLDTGVVPIGALLKGSGGYTMLQGMVEGDQSFRIDIYQGATTARLDLLDSIASELVGGVYSALVRWPIAGEYVQVLVTNTAGIDMTFTEMTLCAMPHGDCIPGLYENHASFVQGSDATASAVTDNPFLIAGEDAGGLVRRAQVIAGATYDPLVVTISGGTAILSPYTDDGAAPTTGIMAGGYYQAVKRALEDGDAGHLSINAYGDLEIAGYNRALGALQVSEIAPIQYDTSVVQLRASAALPAAGAYDAAPTEIPTGSRRYLLLGAEYTRGAAGGSFRHRVRCAVTYGGADTWYQPAVVNTGAFAAGADVNSQNQREDHSYQATGAAAEHVLYLYDLGRAHKVRVAARELGAVANPGTLELLGILFNG